jgi:hypothetical protein
MKDEREVKHVPARLSLGRLGPLASSILDPHSSHLPLHTFLECYLHLDQVSRLVQGGGLIVIYIQAVPSSFPSTCLPRLSTSSPCHPTTTLQDGQACKCL